MGQIKHVSTNTPVEEILDILDKDAGVIIDEFLSEKELSLIKKELVVSWPDQKLVKI